MLVNASKLVIFGAKGIIAKTFKKMLIDNSHH